VLPPASDPEQAMNIDRNNYEEYFILYLDNELSAEDRRRVDLFVQENPDLQAELQLFLQTKLPADDTILFDNKEALLLSTGSIGSNNQEEWLLMSIDNELDTHQQKELEEYLQRNPAAQQELALLQKTKLGVDTAIVFPDKESLYRKEDTTKAPVIPMRWMRMAVAAVLLLAVSISVVKVFTDKKPATGTAGGNEVAVKENATKNTNPATTTGTTTIAPVTTDSGNDQQTLADVPKEQHTEAQTKKENNAAPVQQYAATNKKDTKPSVQQQVVADPAKDQAQNIAATTNQVKPNNNLPQPKNNPNVNDNAPANRGNDNSTQQLAVNSPTQKDKTVEPLVTNSNAQPSYTAYNTEENQSSKKGKLRGFFRKVTRTFEKKANVDVTDKDDQLLVAGFAIKM